MEFFYYIIIGIIQGFTEFLPISSSGHVLLFEDIFNISKPGFSEAINIGSFLAVILFFHKELFLITKNQLIFFLSKKSFSPRNQPNLKNTNHKSSGLQKENINNKNDSSILGDPNLLFKLLLVSLPISILGKTVDIFWDYENSRFTLLIIGVSSVISGITLLYFYRAFQKNILRIKQNKSKQKSTHSFHRPRLIDYIYLSFFQAIAIIPGASRSGMSLIGAYARNLNPKDIGLLIFLMSIPPTGLATLNELILKDNFQIDLNFLLSSIFCFITATIAIKFLLNTIKNFQLEYLVYYKILFGFIAIGFYFV